jgi:hypothetical protein
LCLFSCRKEATQIRLERNNENNYNITTDDGSILISFLYNKKNAEFPTRIIIPNHNLVHPMMVFIEFNDKLNISNYKISDGIFFEDWGSVFQENDIYVMHRMRIKNSQVVYMVKSDGTIEIIDYSEIVNIDE